MTEINSSHQNKNKELLDKENSGMTFHLAELRKRVLYIFAGILVVFLLCLPFSQWLFEQFARPVLLALSNNQSLIIRKPLDSFLIPLKLCLFLSVILSLPWILHQIWGFVAPGLYNKEKRVARPLLISTSLLFYLGILFAYFIVLPIAFQFLADFAPKGSTYGPDISDYFSFVFTVFFAFGIAFEVPIATILLVILGITDTKSLAKKRRYIIVGAFIFGMILTPPDIISQTLLAVPMWILFEIGLFFAKRIEKKRQSET